MDTDETRKAQARERQRRSRAKRKRIEFCPTERALAKLDRIMQSTEVQLLEMSRSEVISLIIDRHRGSL